MAVNSIRATPVSLVEILGMAIEALWSNKLRTALTMLGMIIGIASVIAITSIGQGVQKSTEQQIQSLGSNVIQIRSGAASSGGVRQGTGSSSTLTWDDARSIKSQVVPAQAVSAYLQQVSQVVYGQQNTSTTILGTDADYPTVRNLALQEGRYFGQDELDAAAPVAVLGPNVRDELMGVGSSAMVSDQPGVIGASIRIQGSSYAVIGVLQPKGAQGPTNPDEQVYIPLTNMSARLVGNNALSGVSVSGVVVQVVSQDQMDAAQFQITNLLRIRHNIYPPQDDDFRITNQADIISTLGGVVSSFTVMVVAIAAISLIVGGIGIANIMLVSVVERTREIGIRKAIGATNAAVLSQFLVEAVMISSVGGGIGIGLGIAIALGAATFLKFPFVVSLWAIVVGFGLSFVVGLLAGVIPARNAAQLDPIAALRSD